MIGNFILQLLLLVLLQVLIFPLYTLFRTPWLLNSLEEAALPGHPLQPSGAFFECSFQHSALPLRLRGYFFERPLVQMGPSFLPFPLVASAPSLGYMGTKDPGSQVILLPWSTTPLFSGTIILRPHVQPEGITINLMGGVRNFIYSHLPHLALGTDTSTHPHRVAPSMVFLPTFTWLGGHFNFFFF